MLHYIHLLRIYFLIQYLIWFPIIALTYAQTFFKNYFFYNKNTVISKYIKYLQMVYYLKTKYCGLSWHFLFRIGQHAFAISHQYRTQVPQQMA